MAASCPLTAAVFAPRPGLGPRQPAEARPRVPEAAAPSLTSPGSHQAPPYPSTPKSPVPTFCNCCSAAPGVCRNACADIERSTSALGDDDVCAESRGSARPNERCADKGHVHWVAVVARPPPPRPRPDPTPCLRGGWQDAGGSAAGYDAYESRPRFATAADVVTDPSRSGPAQN
ncbi:hypothetical protein RJ55_05523 [Drechmeria coniospora]|nr:hypothetical protein RJ55_05523 [Drechmeria coniospora]